MLNQDGKVNFEKRNIMTQPLKHGRYGAAYFSNDLVEDKNMQEKIRLGTIQDYNNKIEKVMKNKEEFKNPNKLKKVFSPASLKYQMKDL